MPDKIVILSPESQCCELGHGLQRCLFVIERSEWTKIGKLLKKFKNSPVVCYEEEFTNGGHGCIIEYNFYGMYQKCQIVDPKPTQEIVDFVMKLKQTEFLEEFEGVSNRAQVMTKKQNVIKFLETNLFDQESIQEMSNLLNKSEFFEPRRNRFEAKSSVSELIERINATNSEIKIVKLDEFVRKYKKENKIK